MRLKVTRSKNAASLYVIKSVYNPKTQSNSSKIVEKLGTEKELREKLGGADPYEWANHYISELNAKEAAQKRTVLVPFKQDSMIPKDVQYSFNGGYLFLQQLYHALGLHQICADISSRQNFSFHLDSILSRLVYSRILFPASKLGTFEESKIFLEQPDFELHQIYRALDVIASEDSFIQSELYKNSKALSKRNDRILFYDCSNFFFETEQENGLRQYGPSKEHRPNPIVEMGLFMDGDGIPLAFSIHPGNENEQQTLIPLEQQILKDFGHSKFIVCTDAGLSSKANRIFNTKGERSFITTQSIKKLKNHLKEWSLDSAGWHLEGDSQLFDLRSIEEKPELVETYRNATFYKERWMTEDGLEQHLIVTFSFQYKHYQQNIRCRQVERARKLIEERPSALKKHHANDCKRFIEKTSITPDGEVADRDLYFLNQETIDLEEKYDGFYAVCTNLLDDAVQISRISHNRWEIEECFRMMKTDFEARPVYLQKDNRIKAHFMTCFLSLILFRYLEKKLDYKYTSTEILKTLRNMNFLAISGEGYIPAYTRTNLTDALHEAFGFRTDYQIVGTSQMKKIFKDTKR